MMISNYRQLFRTATLLLLLGCCHTTRAIDELLTLVGCFVGNDKTSEEIGVCVRETVLCLDDAMVDDIRNCMTSDAEGTELLGPVEQAAWLAGKVGPCFGPWSECITPYIDMVRERYDECFHQNLFELFKCYAENGETCGTSCSKEDIPSGPIIDLGAATPLDILRCGGFQEFIMDPICDIVDCCDACVGAYEALMNCIAVDIMGVRAWEVDDSGILPIPRPADCTLECGAGVVAAPKQGDRALAEEETLVLTPESMADECLGFFENRGAADVEGLAGKLLEGQGLRCIVETSFDLAVEEGQTGAEETLEEVEATVEEMVENIEVEAGVPNAFVGQTHSIVVVVLAMVGGLLGV